jgi:hypothetical protein
MAEISGRTHLPIVSSISSLLCDARNLHLALRPHTDHIDLPGHLGTAILIGEPQPKSKAHTITFF